MRLDDEQRRFFTVAETDHEGHAQCCAGYYGDKFRYTTTHGWMRYNGKFYERDGAEQAVERAITNTLRKRREIYAGAEEWKKANACAAYRNVVTGTKAQMAKMSDIFANINDFDADHEKVNALNGVVNLREKSLAPHDPSQLFTYCLPVEYKPELENRADVLMMFLATCEITPEVIEYLRLALGYSLTGYTWEEILFYLFGPTRSGKGTFTETINIIFGALGAGVDMESFTSKRYGDTSNFDLAPLKGKRFITAGESQRHGQLNPAFIKKITGGDEIYCSFKRKDHFSYRPQFKVWLTSNFEASTDVDDDAAWGRLRVIKFPTSFLGKEDKTLKARLRAKDSLDAIFAWIVSGGHDYLNHLMGSGLRAPAEIAEATKEHRALQDSVGQFIEQSCEVGEALYVEGAELYRAYKSWCEDEGYLPVGRKRFTQSLAARGVTVDIKKVAGKSIRAYLSVGLKFLEI